ncbi:MAG: nicotinamide mononucleotide transporter [Clostridia bacterium]|nr:nicotinamide mononucleotide transporter [Clostridia bacterium]
MKLTVFTRENLPRLCLIGVTAVLITVTGILYGQSALRILPLYISLIVGALQSQASRYASLIGGCNSLLYMLVYLYLGLYASAGYALLFSCPVQIATFIRWSRNSYGSSTRFRRLTGKQRILVGAGFLVCFGVLYLVLKAAGSSYQLLDNVSSLLGILISILTMLAFIEYTWLMLPSGLLNIVLNAATMLEHPEQITYLIFSLYSLICVTKQFFRVRKLYARQTAEEAPQSAIQED